VAKSGAMPYRDDMTVGEAVDNASPTPFADLKRVKLIRSGAEYVLDLRKAGGQPAATRLEPGDRLVIPKD
jgi:protein involved in polysaccharide export with SLBB domain